MTSECLSSSKHYNLSLRNINPVIEALQDFFVLKTNINFQSYFFANFEHNKFLKKKVMKPEFEELTLVNDEAKKRFYIEVDGHLAFINYDYAEGEHQIALVHTEAEPELLGTGAAAAVVEKTLHYIKENGKKLLPFCPYIFAYIKKHPEWKAIVDETFAGYDQL